MLNTCQICHNTDQLIYYTVSEKMMGSGDEFEYFKCPKCGCLQISKIPQNLAHYYDNGYYSFNLKNKFEEAPLRSWIDKHRVKAALFQNDILGQILNAISKPLEYIPWILEGKASLNSSILDVGCGQGRLLLRMALGGFKNLTGIDPFIENDLEYTNGVKIYKEDLQTFTEKKHQYDVIMLHHSFEHMPEQFLALNATAKLLKSNGTILLRIPLCDSYAWEHYEKNWVQLDAPRHLFLHTKKSIELLAKNSNLVIKKIIYDSSKFQFTGSELYRRGIALNSNKKDKIFLVKKK